MPPPTPTPSARLRRAAAAERTDLRRHRERLVATRDQLQAELAEVEASLRDLDERDALLARLAGPDHAGEEDRRPAAAAPGDVATPLRGPAIRRAAVQTLLSLPDRPQALHYRAWYDALTGAGLAVAGKDPLAVFLTQLGRSPVIRRGTQSGVYELDRDAPRRLRAQLEALHADLRGLTATPHATADLTAIRARRAAMTTQISQVEKALEEAEALLGAGGSAGAPAAAAG
jgi:chaperonin cofactor prefoldin